MQIACSLAVALLFVLTGSCSQTRGAPPDLLEPSQYQMSYEERLRLEIAAPLIVVGRVTTVHSIGPPTRSRGDQRVLIQLTKISVNVEVVVKGDLKTPSVDFYYYLFSEKNERYLGRKRYEPVVGDRRLFFLTSFDGEYRAVGDVFDYTLPVRSGYHAADFCNGKTPGRCIAELLLVPGRGFEPESFAERLYDSQSAAAVLCSPSCAIGLLQQLASNPDERVAKAARGILGTISPDVLRSLKQ